MSGPSEAGTANTSLSQASSSLAHAFGGEQGAHGQADNQGQGAAADAAASYMAQQTFRPGFKRLASQTLGPANAKRALLGPAGWDDVRRGSEESEALEEDDELDEEDATNRRFGKNPYSGSRRFSLPTNTNTGDVTLPPIRSSILGHEQGQAQQQMNAFQQA